MRCNSCGAGWGSSSWQDSVDGSRDEVSRHTSEKPKGIPAFKGAVGGDSGERRCVPRLFDALI